MTLLAASIAAMQAALADLATGVAPSPRLVPFTELRRLVGFEAYDAECARYRTVVEGSA